MSVWLRCHVGNIHIRENQFCLWIPKRVVYTTSFQSQGNHGATGWCEKLQLQGDCETRSGKKRGAARVRARATRRGYNPRTRRIFHVRKCRHSRRHDCWKKNTLEFNYRLEALNIAIIKSCIYSKILSTTFLEHICLILLFAISYFLLYL